MVKWLSYLEIATQKDFRNKAEKLAINMPASKGNIEGKKVSLGYKFKLPNTNA